MGVDRRVTSLGVLTMCHHSDWHKAIGLAMSIRARSPGTRLAVVADESLWSRLSPYFEYLIPEISGLRGFEHKVHLDDYSPFQRTLFVDADMLAFKDISSLISRWAGSPFIARGSVVQSGTSSFGLRRDTVLQRLGKSNYSCFDGAGHYYFEKPGCRPVFERGRELIRDINKGLPGARVVADEDVFGVVATELDIEPDQRKDVVGFLGAVQRWVDRAMIVEGRCRYIDLAGDLVEPVFLHFPRDMAPLRYHRLLSQLSKAYNGPADVGWLTIGWREWCRKSVLSRCKWTMVRLYRTSRYRLGIGSPV